MKAEKRNGLEIRIWMMREGITQLDIVAKTKIAKSNVSRTISGERNCRAVLEYLLQKGCPVELLELPEDMTAAA